MNAESGTHYERICPLEHHLVHTAEARDELLHIFFAASPGEIADVNSVLVRERHFIFQ